MWTSRRRWLLGGGALVLAVVVSGRLYRGASPVGPAWVSRISPETLSSRPNLLLVVYDARRRDDFSFGPFGNRRGDTPFLDRFKDRAAYFENAVSPGCWTVPAHAAMFSGLSVCELGNDYYNPGWTAMPAGFLSLPEVLKLAGYETVAYPDHPYFYNSHEDVSLIRGFERFNVISDFESYTSATNVATPGGRVVHEPRLEVRHDTTAEAATAEAVRAFRDGKWVPASGEGDHDPANDVLLARLTPLYRQSPYFQQRYGREFDAHIFPQGPRRRPFFLFLNLHMATVARPDPALFARWATETVLLNAVRLRKPVQPPGPGQGFDAWLTGAAAALGLRHAPFPSPALYLKHVFDNRFYDASFEAVHEFLEQRGLMRNTVTVVTSDHGMSLGENGESLYQHAGARPYQYIVGVPLVVRFPEASAEVPLHGRYRDPVSLVDLFPTLVELGVGQGIFERSHPVRGRSLVSRLRNRSYEPYVIAEAAWGPSSHRVAPGAMAYSKAVIAGGWKLVHAPEVYQTPPGAPGWPVRVRLGETWSLPAPGPILERRAEGIDFLFDLEADPDERNDLGRQRPEEVARLKALVRSWSCQSLPWGQSAPIWQGESLATLRALGYIQ